MEGRRNLSLPEGYWARQVDGVWYLFDQRNVMLAGPADAARIEEYAWHDVWRRIDEDIDDEIAAFQAGVRPLHELRRMRQYFRMWDDVASLRSAPRTGPIPMEPGFRRVIAAAAVAAAAALIIIATGAARGPGGLTLWPRPDRNAGQASATFPKPLAAALANVGSVEVVPPAEAGPAPAATPRATPPAQQTARRRPVVKYAATVGSFASAASAQRMMHLVRRKGYIVDVVPRGELSEVVTPPYRTRRQAASVVRGLEEIGLPAELTAYRVP